MSVAHAEDQLAKVLFVELLVALAEDDADEEAFTPVLSTAFGPAA